MPSSKEQMIREQMFGGMSRGTRDHLTAPNQWRTSYGMRHFETQVRQVSRKKELFTVLANHFYPVSLLVNLPTGYENFGIMIGLTDSGVFRLTSTGANRLSAPDGSTKLLTADGVVRRFGHTTYNGRLFFVNELNRVHSTDGTIVREIENSPCGQYVETFFEHIVVGRPTCEGTNIPWRFQWSGLYDFTQWVAETHTESDHFDCTEHQSEEDYTGITGLRRLGPLLCVYTPSAIYVSRYVGLPRVMVTDAVVQDYGCGLPYALAAVNRSHYFIDTREMSFFQFDGGMVTEIGRPIKDYFFADLSTNQAQRLRTYSYVDSVYKEIHWVYISAASVLGDYDKEVVFNYKANTWWTGPVENIWSFCKGNRRTKTIDELSGTIDGLSGTIESLSEASDVVGRVYGSRNGRLLRDEITADTTASLIEQDGPHLETGDFHYGDIENHKEVESMVIHSKYDDALGIDVFAATRNNIDDAVNLVLQSQIWTPTLFEQRLSLPRISGRVFRYKFQPRATSSSVVETTFTRPTSGFALLAQIPAVTEPPPPTVSLLFSGTQNSNPVEYSFSVTVPAGSNRGMFVWVHYEKAHSIVDFTMTLLINGLAATSVYRADDPEDPAFMTEVFWIAAPATGAINVTFANPAINGVFYAGRVHIAGVCLNGMNQTTPIISLQTSFNVLSNGFSFPLSTNSLLVAGLVVFDREHAIDVPLATAYPGSAFTASVRQTTTASAYIDAGMVALGYVVGGTAPIVGWTMDASAEGMTGVPLHRKFDWWNIAVALRGV